MNYVSEGRFDAYNLGTKNALVMEAAMKKITGALFLGFALSIAGNGAGLSLIHI